MEFFRDRIKDRKPRPRQVCSILPLGPPRQAPDLERSEFESKSFLLPSFHHEECKGHDGFHRAGGASNNHRTDSL